MDLYKQAGQHTDDWHHKAGTVVKFTISSFTLFTSLRIRSTSVAWPWNLPIGWKNNGICSSRNNKHSWEELLSDWNENRQFITKIKVTLKNQSFCTCKISSNLCKLCVDKWEWEFKQMKVCKGDSSEQQFE